MIPGHRGREERPAIGLPPRAFAAAALAALAALPPAAAADWPQFGLDASRSNASTASTGITAATVGGLRLRRVAVDGTVDSSPILLQGVSVRGARRDVAFVTTTYGRTLALDVRSGAVLWRFVPRGIAAWDGSAQITTASPAADTGRAWIFAASPDGEVHKLSVATGAEAPGWPVPVSRDPTREKLSTALAVSGPYVYATLGGYYGDAPSYQGKVVVLDRASGRVAGVFNALCSRRRAVIVPSSCPASGAAIWGRAGAVVEPGGNLLVATGNGPWDGRTSWGDSVLELSPTGLPLHSWTPSNQQQLEDGDVDLGSTSPAVLTPTLALQGGKDGILRVLALPRLGGGDGAGAHTGGELSTASAPGAVFTAPAVWHTGGATWVFVGTGSGLAAYRLSTGGTPRLVRAWSASAASTSPVLAGGLLYAYDPGGALNVYSPATGKLLARLPAGPGHWNSPVVANGVVVLPEGDANAHARRGTVDLYRTR